MVCLDLYALLCVSVYSRPDFIVNVCVFFVYLSPFVCNSANIYCVFKHFYSVLCDDVIPGGCIPGTGAEVNGANGSG